MRQIIKIKHGVEINQVRIIAVAHCIQSAAVACFGESRLTKSLLVILLPLLVTDYVQHNLWPVGGVHKLVAVVVGRQHCSRLDFKGRFLSGIGKQTL